MKEIISQIAEDVRKKVAGNDEALKALNEVEEMLIKDVDEFHSSEKLSAFISEKWYCKYGKIYSQKSLQRSCLALFQQEAKKLGQ